MPTSTPAPTPPPTLFTPRLTLTPPVPADLEESAAMWSDPAVYTMIGGQPRPREDVWIRLLRAIGTWHVFDYGSWTLRETATGRFAGEAGLLENRRAIEPPIDTLPEVGWTLAGWAHGRGFAREALDPIFAWADAQGIARTVCIIDPGNAPSIRLAERVGYRLRTTGRYHDRPIGIYDRSAS